MYQTVDLQPSPQQLARIREELGREPAGMQAITAIDGRGAPLVVQVSALVKGKPFPTLFWLSSRFLVRELSHLEAAGVIKQLEQRLQEDEALMEAYQESHRDYVRRRWAAMSPQIRAEVARLGFNDVFEKRGIGGIENWQQIRCLHTQYAHHLCGDNVIGRLLDKEYKIADRLP